MTETQSIADSASVNGLPRLTKIDFWLIGILALATTIAFWHVSSCRFIAYDDPEYVSSNPAVQAGLNQDSVIWAIDGFHGGFYFPITWLSFMLDVSLFGNGPMAHHLVNLILHIANGALLYLGLRWATADRVRSAAVAFLFLVHPLRVESVAWITERKDVLSGLFGFASLALYVRYAATQRRRDLVPATLAFALSLLAKQMMIMLPVVLLLLDFWPLRRLPPDPRRMKQLLLEKLPMFALSILAGVVALWAASRAGSVLEASQEIPLAIRLENAIQSYVLYGVKFVDWRHLAIFYPYPTHIDGTFLTICSATIVLVTLGAVLLRDRYPFLAVGWGWYLVAFLPMIGLVQSGDQAMADRHTYFPMIGLAVALVWSLPLERLIAVPWRVSAAGLAIVVAILLIVAVRIQVAYWKDDLKLFGHAVEVTADNGLAEAILGKAFREQNNYEQALVHLSKAVRLNPAHPTARIDLGLELARRRDYQGAMQQFEEAARLQPSSAEAQFDVGLCLERLGRGAEAAGQYRKTLELRSDFEPARAHLARLGSS